MPLVIDAHQHFWDVTRFRYPWMEGDELEPLRRNHLPPDLEPLLGRAGVDRTVFVQTRHDLDENRWALRLCARHDFIAGVVGWIDLAGEACDEQLSEFAGHPRFVGVRHLTHDEADDDWIVRDEVLRGLRALERRGLPFDLLLRPRHLRHVPALARRLPGLPMVIDHLAKPAIKAGRVEGWRQEFEAAARYPNVHCKLSGMVTESDWRHWTVEDLEPYVRIALDAFGPERLMFGSDWPVCTLAASYEQVAEALSEALGPISAGERAAIFGGTAARFYRLPEAERPRASRPGEEP